MSIATKKTLRKLYIDQIETNKKILDNNYIILDRALEGRPYIIHKIQRIEETQLAIQEKLIQLNKELATLGVFSVNRLVFEKGRTVLDKLKEIECVHSASSFQYHN